MPNLQLIASKQKVAYALIPGIDANGLLEAVQPNDLISVTSSDISSIEVVPDATPVAGSVASGFLVAGTKVQAGVQITGQCVHFQAATIQAPPQLIDVVSGTPTAGPITTLTLGLGSPVSQ